MSTLCRPWGSPFDRSTIHEPDIKEHEHGLIVNNEGPTASLCEVPIQNALHVSFVLEQTGFVLIPTPVFVTSSSTCHITKGSPLGDTLSLSCEASVGTSGSNN